MVIADSPGNFQQEINYLSFGFEFIRAYIDDFFILPKDNWTDHAYKL